MSESPTRTMRATRNRYEPIAELGRGATATVWRARDTRTGSEVALKRFHPHLVSDPVARRRIEEEAAAASRVSHPNIVSATQLIDDREGLALVFPYIAGKTLATRMADEGRMAPREAASIALDIADALATAHAHGVVHRDVKPGNILLGADGRARLLDFGISHAVDEDQLAHDLTGAGMAIGTLPYMAPEQLAAEPTTPASDVYALGAVLYEMLAGKRPYVAASPVTLAKNQTQPPARIANAPEPLVNLALAAMTADIGMRPDAAQLARSLSAWRDGRTDPDAATGLVVAASKLPPRQTRRWSLLALGMAALIVALALPLAATWPGPSPDRLELASATIDRPDASTPRSSDQPATQPPVTHATTSRPPPDRETGTQDEPNANRDKPAKTDKPDKPGKPDKPDKKRAKH